MIGAAFVSPQIQEFQFICTLASACGQPFTWCKELQYKLALGSVGDAGSRVVAAVNCEY